LLILRLALRVVYNVTLIFDVAVWASWRASPLRAACS
jgi:hypothetical protein